MASKRNRNSEKVENATDQENSGHAVKSVVRFDPLQRYLSEISRYRLLTREEEVELGRRVQEEGDTDAAYQLVTSNLRLVVKIAKNYMM